MSDYIARLVKAVSKKLFDRPKAKVYNTKEIKVIKNKEEKVKEEIVLLAVYGNEKKGFCRHNFLKKNKFIGSGVTKKRFTMISRGYPIIFKSPMKAQVKVEVYEIPETWLNYIDKVVYMNGFIASRETIIVVLDDNSEVKANIYVGNNRWKEENIKSPAPNSFGVYEHKEGEMII